MNIPFEHFSDFTRCPVIYDLHSRQGVPMPPTTRMVVSSVVRAEVLRELRLKLATGDIPPTDSVRQAVSDEAARQMSQDIAYTDEESSRGQRTAFERVVRSALSLIGPWRSAVAPRIDPLSVSQPFEFSAGEHTVTGTVDIVEATNIRVTRIRQRRPSDDECQHNLGLFMMAGEKNVIVDYLVDADLRHPLVFVDRQIAIPDSAKENAARERVLVMVRAIEAGVFAPTDPQYWRCQACSLRACCRYV